MTTLLTTDEAAAALRVSPWTLACWRSRRTGPPYVKIGGRVAYQNVDLEAYLAARRRPTND
jgi:hypothetical protein